jgi:hypothetical protein
MKLVGHFVAHGVELDLTFEGAVAEALSKSRRPVSNAVRLAKQRLADQGAVDIIVFPNPSYVQCLEGLSDA